MSIETPEDLAGLQNAGQVVREVLDAMKKAAAPGATTLDLDHVARDVMRKHCARSAPRLVYRFPGYTCISINEEAVHGIPSKRKLRPNDVVKLDVTVELNGYMADAAETVVMPPGTIQTKALADCAKSAFESAFSEVRPGHAVREIGRRVGNAVRGQGFSVIRELCGHGIGRVIHEPPEVPNYDDPRNGAMLTEGLVLTIEPIIALGNGGCFTKSDGWTVRTRDGSVAAHYEHTLVVTRSAPLLLTA
jgi:methionyl aminopeptidase